METKRGGGGGSEVRAEFSNSPIAGGDLQSVNLDSATEATMHDYCWWLMLVAFLKI